MERMVLALAIAAAAAGVAAFLRARRPTPTLTAAGGVPDRVDRADFALREAAWLYIVFSSTTCESCPAAVAASSVVTDDEVAATEVEFSARRDLHTKYAIEAVPLTLLVDAEGRVHQHFLGRTSADQLAEALETARTDVSEG